MLLIYYLILIINDMLLVYIFTLLYIYHYFRACSYLMETLFAVKYIVLYQQWLQTSLVYYGP